MSYNIEDMISVGGVVGGAESLSIVSGPTLMQRYYLRVPQGKNLYLYDALYKLSNTNVSIKVEVGDVDVWESPDHEGYVLVNTLAKAGSTSEDLGELVDISLYNSSSLGSALEYYDTWRIRYLTVDM